MINFANIKESHIKVILCLLAIISFFSTINILPPLDRDEARYIQSSSQMMETKDFLNINFLDTPRLKKPPASYWLQSLSATIVKNIFSLDKPPLWSFRIPSAIASSISLLLVYLLGNIILGRLEGILGAFLFLSAPIVLIESNIAKTDAILSCLVLSLIYLTAKIIFVRNKEHNIFSKEVFLLWVILGFSFLVKGPIALTIFVLFIISFKIFDKDFNFQIIKIFYGFLIFLLISLPWYLYIISGGTADSLVEEVKNDFLAKLYSGQESHGAPPGSYLFSFFIIAWPIAIFLIPTTIWTFLNRKHKSVKYLLSYILPSWLLLEIIPTKLLHYILPLIPGIALLTAAMIVDQIKNNNISKFFNNIYIKIFSILPILGVFIIVFVIFYLGKEYGAGLSTSILLISSLFILIGIISFYYIYNLDFYKATMIAAFGNIIAINLFLIFIPYQMQKLWVSERIYKEIQNSNIDRPLILLGYSEPSLIYRIGSSTKIARSTMEALNLINKKKLDYIIIEKNFLEQFKILCSKNNIEIFSYGATITGFNYSKGKNVEINIFKINFK